MVLGELYTRRDASQKGGLHSRDHQLLASVLARYSHLPGSWPNRPLNDSAQDRHEAESPPDLRPVGRRQHWTGNRMAITAAHWTAAPLSRLMASRCQNESRADESFRPGLFPRFPEPLPERFLQKASLVQRTELFKHRLCRRKRQNVGGQVLAHGYVGRTGDRLGGA